MKLISSIIVMFLALSHTPVAQDGEDEKLKQFFGDFDLNSDGKLDEEQLKAGLMAYLQKYGENEEIASTIKQTLEMLNERGMDEEESIDL